MKQFLLNEINRHPYARPQDILKLLYQAAFGAEHIINPSAKDFLIKEYEQTKPCENMALFDKINEEVYRVNIAAWKYKQLPIDWLFDLFFLSSYTKQELDLKIVEDTNMPFSLQEWQDYLKTYEYPKPVRHSDTYREHAKPAYRVIAGRYTRLLPVFELLGNNGGVIAIEGRAASGKTTLANDLARIIKSDVIHMDDFFLPKELRTNERLNEPGGNIHYERFINEVLSNLNTSFEYKIFDCNIMDYNGVRHINENKWHIVEGVYSLHPLFGDYANIKIFSDIVSNEQMKRIIKRNGEAMAKMFKEKWIPMEEKYFSHFNLDNHILIK